MPSDDSRSSHQAATGPGSFSWNEANTLSADDTSGSQVAAAVAVTRSVSITLEDWLNLGTGDKLIGWAWFGGRLESNAPTAGTLSRPDLVNHGPAPPPWHSNPPMSMMPFTMRGTPPPPWSQS